MDTKPQTELSHFQKIFVLFNPVAGHADSDGLRTALEEFCALHGWDHEIYQTTARDDLAILARRSVEQGVDLVIAAGGDGTVTGAINGLVGTPVPLAVIPVGTGNGLARALNIPLDPPAAIELLAGDHRLIALDALQVGERYFLLNVSAGISARSIEKTSHEDKQSYGMLAYARKIAGEVIETQPSVFQLELDGHTLRVRAIEVLVSNNDPLETAPNIFGTPEQFKDGQASVAIVTADSPGDYVRLAFNLLLDPQEPGEDVHTLTVRRSIRIDVEGESQPVQADGEVIGRTPVEVLLVPGLLRVLAPCPTET